MNAHTHHGHDICLKHVCVVIVCMLWSVIICVAADGSRLQCGGHEERVLVHKLSTGCDVGRKITIVRYQTIRLCEV